MASPPSSLPLLLKPLKLFLHLHLIPLLLLLPQPLHGSAISPHDCVLYQVKHMDFLLVTAGDCFKDQPWEDIIHMEIFEQKPGGEYKLIKALDKAGDPPLKDDLSAHLDVDTCSEHSFLITVTYKTSSGQQASQARQHYHYRPDWAHSRDCGKCAQFDIYTREGETFIRNKNYLNTCKGQGNKLFDVCIRKLVYTVTDKDNKPIIDKTLPTQELVSVNGINIGEIKPSMKIGIDFVFGCNTCNTDPLTWSRTPVKLGDEEDSCQPRGSSWTSLSTSLVVGSSILLVSVILILAVFLGRRRTETGEEEYCQDYGKEVDYEMETQVTDRNPDYGK